MNKRPDYLFVSEGDGGLYDTRRANWSKLPPVRTNYARHHRCIKSLADLKANLRAGDYAWPGGYPIAYYTRDGASLCPECIRQEWHQVVYDFMFNTSSGWRVEACEALEGDPEIEEWPYCEGCSSRIGGED